MSIESSLSSCLVSTGLAGIAFAGAVGTGTLGAGACVSSMGTASVDCYEAGLEAWDWYEQNYPEKAREILERERQQKKSAEEIDLGSFLDDAADDDGSWNIVYSTGTQYLMEYSQAVDYKVKIGSEVKRIPKAAFKASSLKYSQQSESLEQARDTLVQICADWEAWYQSLSSLKFSSLEHASSFASMINNATRFIGMKPLIMAMVFQD